MPIYGPEYAIDRIVATLQANLPAEFDLVQSISGLDPIPNGLDDVPNGSYYKIQLPVALVSDPLAILVYAVGSDPLQIDSVVNTPGRWVGDHMVTVEYQIKDTGNEQPHVTQARAMRSATAIIRVLCIKNITLGGTVNRITMTDRTVYGSERGSEDEAGEFTRIARLPFAVRVYENL
jgi:hypothetical protein